MISKTATQIIATAQHNGFNMFVFILIALP